MMEFISNFAVIEGSDGSGTTTLLSNLKKKLQNTGKSVFFTTFEPTNSPTGSLVRSALKKEITLEPETLCYLFAADRTEHPYEYFSQHAIYRHYPQPPSAYFHSS